MYCVCTAASAVWYVCKLCIVSALLPAQCAVCVSLSLCWHYCQRSMLRYVCKSCIAFALLPVQCDACVSPVLCLLNVLREQFAMWAMISPLIIAFLFLPIPTSWEWMSTRSSIITVIFPVVHLREKLQGLLSNIPQ